MKRMHEEHSTIGKVWQETSIGCAVPKSWSAHAQVTCIVRCADTVPLRNCQVVLVIDDGKSPWWFEIKWIET
jgi:hypothetical protein